MADLYRSAARIGQVGVLDIGPHDCRELAVAVNTAVPTALRAEPPDAVLRCDCCATPLAVIRDGYIEVRQKHHGETHVTRLSVERLLELLRRRAA